MSPNINLFFTMQNIKDYLKSVGFSMSYAFRFAPRETFTIMFIAAITGVIPYLSSWFLGRLVNSIVDGAKSGSYDGVWIILFLQVSVSALPTILNNIRLYINRHWQLTLYKEIELDIFKHRERIDIARYEDPKFQDLLQRAFRQGPYVPHDLASQQSDLVSAVFSLMVGTILAIHFNWHIYLIVIASAVPSFITDIKYASKGWSIWSTNSPEQRRYADLREHLRQRTAIVETKLLQSGNKILKWMRKILEDFEIVQLKLEKSKVLHTSLADVLSYVGFAGAGFLLVKEIIDGGVPVGSLVYMIGTLSNVRGSIANILLSVSRQYEKHLVVKDIMEVISTKPVIIDASHPVKLNLSSVPEIVFENVTFKYPTSDAPTLENINLTLKPGNKIGLVGNNGAGKTTFVKLLCRIYDPTEGRILVNGVDLKDVSIKEWWSYLGVMFQDYASYDFKVKEAIAISRPEEELDIDRVKNSAELAQAHTFIEEWKDMYDEQLGVEFSGKEPSKGQRQKLSIAKTIYRNAFLMILDEPTASVDAESEAKIFDSLEHLSENTTALLISHDFSTILQCNHIFVFEKGKLIEEGNHKELMKIKGVYADLYDIQASRFKK